MTSKQATRMEVYSIWILGVTIQRPGYDCAAIKPGCV